MMEWNLNGVKKLGGAVICQWCRVSFVTPKWNPNYLFLLVEVVYY